VIVGRFHFVSLGLVLILGTVEIVYGAPHDAAAVAGCAELKMIGSSTSSKNSNDATHNSTDYFFGSKARGST
jgi:hypothetical protein